MTTEFRTLTERITALEEAKRARAEERAKGTAKGADFEVALESGSARWPVAWATWSSCAAPMAATQ